MSPLVLSVAKNCPCINLSCVNKHFPFNCDNFIIIHDARSHLMDDWCDSSACSS